MARVRLYDDEWYPVLVIAEPEWKMGTWVDVPDDLVARYEKALAEFNAVQDALFSLRGTRGGPR